MGLMDKLRGEFIDIVEWLDDSRDTIVWRFPRYDNEIKMGAKLVVRESQTAVFVNEGQVADAFTPGNGHYSGSLPVLTTADRSLYDLYYRGVASVLALERTRGRCVQIVFRADFDRRSTVNRPAEAVQHAPQ